MKLLRRIKFRKTEILAAIFLTVCSIVPAWSAALTEADKKIWILCIKRVKMKPPCCGACKLLTQEDAKALWEYIASDDPAIKRKSEAVWKEHKVKLLAEFKHLSPGRYRELYGAQDPDKKE